MRAELVDQPDLASSVAEREQLLAKNLNPHLRTIRLRYLSRQQGGHPVPPHQITHPGSWAGANQCFRHFFVHVKRTFLAVLSIW
jgi:hypothetical protein